MTLLAGGTPRVVECGIEDRFKLSPVALERALSPATRWLWLNSPCNPTGASYSRREFAALGEVLQKYPRVLIMSDEIYEHIHYTDEPPISFASACPSLAHRTVIVNGVSKTYAMTGWRIGYAAGPRRSCTGHGKDTVAVNLEPEFDFPGGSHRGAERTPGFRIACTSGVSVAT